MNPDDPENKLTNAHFPAFHEALELLFIESNISGRNKFSALWPEAALWIFGEDLMRFDTQGAVDRTYRAALEEEAEDRRLTLLSLLENLQNKCVVYGVLQTERVQGLVEKMGRGTSLYVFDQKIVDRFAPSVEAASAGAPCDTVTETPSARAVPAFEAKGEVIPEMLDDPFGSVQPISLDVGPVKAPQEPVAPLPLVGEDPPPAPVREISGTIRFVSAKKKDTPQT